MDRMRKLIADHMIKSQETSAHVTSFVEADVTHLVQWREKIKLDFDQNISLIRFGSCNLEV
jgi:2-oxoglutarate dehydrogenase E2 component (dihydrolipoamide succinyltransferase)